MTIHQGRLLHPATKRSQVERDAGERAFHGWLRSLDDEALARLARRDNAYLDDVEECAAARREVSH